METKELVKVDLNDQTLEKIIKTATLIVSCAYEIYRIWTSDLAKG